jgi:hypothetical protein
MTGLAELWLPILLATVAVFMASSLSHAILTYHDSDHKGLPGEDKVTEAMRNAGVKPGNYFFPHPGSRAARTSPEYTKKCEQGPVGMVNVFPDGPPAMGKALGLWTVYILFVSVLVAYASRIALVEIAGIGLVTNPDFMRVFRVASVAAFLAYAAGEPMASIWAGRGWAPTLKNMADGLVYALLTGAIFAWLWPN